MNSFRRLATCTLIALSLTAHLPAHAIDPSTGSALSALSGLPVAVSITAPVALLSAGAVLTVVSVQASAEGTVWVLERASDGVRASVKFTGQAVGGLSIAAGTLIEVTVVGAGWVLSAAGKAIAFIPNELGKALMHNERITR